MKVKRVYLKLLALLPIPFLLTGCTNEVDCNIPNDHVHKYIGSNNRGTVETYLNSEYEQHEVSYEDGSLKFFKYVRKDDYLDITYDDKSLYEAKETMFIGKENWDYLFNIMKAKRDFIKYEYEWNDGEDWHYDWTTKKPSKYDYNGRLRVYHYQFCGHRLVYKNGKWVNERSPFVDDIRDIIDDYPYFELDCYRTVYKTYNIKYDKLKDLKLEDIDEYKQPDLSTNELHPKTK